MGEPLIMAGIKDGSTRFGICELNLRKFGISEFKASAVQLACVDPDRGKTPRALQHPT
jgi:hypothetical protein